LDKLQLLDGGIIVAEVGVPCARLLPIGIKEGMLDMAFLAGIPGTVGGALAMNAGAYNQSIWQYVHDVITINRYGELKQRKIGEFHPGYRQVDGLAIDEWFVSCSLQLTKKHVKELLLKRRATQPLNTLNCGSVFRNPPNDYAARLIEVCGLKGRHIGGAVVSKKHANFITNDGTATAQDIKELIEYVVDAVHQKFGVKLEKEVKFLG
jgi:UDP-N-acetylmuramate dehydrogenase